MSSSILPLQVQGYPTLKFFPAGPKSWDSAEDYDGGRVSADIVQWCLNKWTATLPPPEVHQVRKNGLKIRSRSNDEVMCYL